MVGFCASNTRASGDTNLMLVNVSGGVCHSKGGDPSDGELAARFRSALGIEDLTALVLQYAMYDKTARMTLAADPALGLAHLYNDHRGGFVSEPHGVEVMGAGTVYINGWYRRREASEGPPKTKHFYHDNRVEDWIELTEGRPWYEKDVGTYIYCNLGRSWRCAVEDHTARYSVRTDAALPPAFGWRCIVSKRLDPLGESEAPAPTLRVVS